MYLVLEKCVVILCHTATKIENRLVRSSMCEKCLKTQNTSLQSIWCELACPAAGINGKCFLEIFGDEFVKLMSERIQIVFFKSNQHSV